jgi:phasin family protein
MMMSPEQLVEIQKANVEGLFHLSNKSVEAVEKLSELNIRFIKTTLAELAENTRTLLSVRDPQEFFALQAGMLQPSIERAMAYFHQVFEVLSGTSAEVTKVAEESMSESQKKVFALVDTAMHNAPAGSENAVALVKSAVAAANNALETAQKAARQATDVAEANLQAMTATAVKATQPPPTAQRAA